MAYIVNNDVTNTDKKPPIVLSYNRFIGKKLRNRSKLLLDILLVSVCWYHQRGYDAFFRELADNIEENVVDGDNAGEKNVVDGDTIND